MPGSSNNSPIRNGSLQTSKIEQFPKTTATTRTANYVAAAATAQMSMLLGDIPNCKSNNNDTKCSSIPNWSVDDVVVWARSMDCLSSDIINCLQNEKIDGGVLLALCEDDIRDMRYRLNYQLPFGDLKKLWLLIRNLQEYHQRSMLKDAVFIGGADYAEYATTTNTNTMTSIMPNDASATTPIHRRQQTIDSLCCQHVVDNNREAHMMTMGCCSFPTNDYVPSVPNSDGDIWTPSMIDGRAANIPPEFFKTFISLGYSFLVTWITSFVMVIVHERVPDMKRYPPLPDIFLDNVPHIPWAFHMCEITGTLLFAIWSCVCIFHKYRMVLLRRFFALAGTVFLLRCVTMLITSLSVPGTHLQCDQSDYAVDDTDLTLTEALELRISRAYTIWSGLGMSIQGVRTCGDYMFSGHTVALTLLNFFITEYTPRNLYFLHTLTWLLNMFGIFFILAAHEHYSIDVFVAFYITSRLFLYYHTLANNQALMSRDSTRTRIWFPMFSYFESSVDGIIPNEFDTLSTLLDGLLRLLLEIKDTCMMTAQRFSVDPPHLALATKNLLLSKQHRNVSTSTHSAMTTAATHGTASFQSPTLPPPSSTFVADSEAENYSIADAAADAAEAAQLEIANGNASGDVTFSKASTKSSSFTYSNHNNNNNNNNSVETTTTTATTKPLATMEAATPAASAEKKQTNKTVDRNPNAKTKVETKKQL